MADELKALCREYALRHSNDHAYLPQNITQAETWEPHAWVLAAIQAAVVAEREACARTCERLAEERFAEFGVTEPDTNASYYTGRDADEYELRHEEDDACAAAIRARGAAHE